MSRTPLVTAIIPTFNYGHFVCDAIDSALAQTHGRIEVVVVDDGSTDDTRARLECYGDRIRYIKQANQGLSAARNTGIRASRGEWIALLDADDVWHREKTEVQLAASSYHSECALVGSAATDVLPEKLPSSPTWRVIPIRELLTSLPIGPSGSMIRRSCLERVGLFDESLRSVEDRDMWLRIASLYPCMVVQSECWWYRTHGAQMNRDAARMDTNYKRVLVKFFEQHAEHADLRRIAWAYLYADNAWTHFAAARRCAAIKYLIASALLHPQTLDGLGRSRRWERTRLLVRCVLGERVFRVLRPETSSP